MSKYTTELRYICEQLADLQESSEDIETVIAAARPKLFDFNYPFFVTNAIAQQHPELADYKEKLETKIIMHYYLREIGSETYGVFKHFLKCKMREIMPYYNQLYLSELLTYDPLTNTDGYDVYTGKRTGTNKQDTENNNTTKTNATGSTDGTTNGTKETSGTESGTSNQTSKHSDTPQSHISVISDGYLSAVDEVNGSTSGTSAGSEETSGTSHSENESESTTTTDATGNLKGEHEETDNNTRHTYGKHGGSDYADMIQKYRKTFLNIDMQIIEELDELFLHIW